MNLNCVTDKCNLFNHPIDNRTTQSSQVNKNKNLQLSESLKNTLIEKKIIDVYGTIIQSKKDSLLPNLEKSQQLCVQELLNMPFSIKAGEYHGETNLTKILSVVGDYYVGRQWGKPKVEIIGGYVRWLILQSPIFCRNILQMLGFDDALPFNFFESLMQYPPDYDIRIILPHGANQEDIRALIDVILGNLATTLSKENISDAKKEILRIGLKKKFISPEDGNKYGVLSFGSCARNSSIELLFVSKLKREFTFTHTSLKLASDLDQWYVTTMGDFGWQAILDVLTRQIHAVSPETIDHQGWALYHSYLTKGYSCSDPDLDTILFNSIMSPNCPLDTLSRCLSNHHRCQSIDLAALSINTYYSNSGQAEALWKMNELTPTTLNLENKVRHPIELLLDSVIRLSLPLKFVAALFEVVALFNASTQLVEHKQAVFLQISLNEQLFLMLSFHPLRSLKNLKESFPKIVDKEQYKNLQYLFSVLFSSDSIVTTLEEKQEIYKKGFEFIDSKEILIRMLAYQLLLHSYKESPQESTLKLLLVRFLEPFINLNSEYRKNFLNCFMQAVAIKVPAHIFAGIQTLNSDSVDPIEILEVWLQSLAISHDPFLMDCAYSIWLNCTKKLRAEDVIKLGRALIESSLSINQKLCLSVFNYLLKQHANKETLLPLFQSMSATIDSSTSIEILLYFKQVLQKLHCETKAKDKTILLLMNHLRARGYLDDAKELLEDLKDEQHSQDQEYFFQWDEFAKEMDAYRWDLALSLAIPLVKGNVNLNHERASKYLGILIANLNSLYSERPQLYSTFIAVLIPGLFNHAENPNKVLCKQLILAIINFSKLCHSGSTSLPPFFSKPVSHSLREIFNFLKNENLFDVSYQFLKEIKVNEISYTSTSSYPEFCMWLFNEMVENRQNSFEEHTWMDILLNDYLFPDSCPKGLVTKAPVPSQYGLKIVERFVEYYLKAGEYNRAISWIDKTIERFVAIVSSDWLLNKLAILTSKLDFSSVALFFIKHADFLNKTLSGVSINLVENLIRWSPKQVKGHELLLTQLLKRFDITLPSLWKYIFQMVAESTNAQAKKELGVMLLDKEEQIFKDFPLERAICWAAVLQNRTCLPQETLLSLLYDNKLISIFKAAHCQSFALNAFKELYLNLSSEMDNEGVLQKIIGYLVEIKNAFDVDFMDQLIFSLISTDNQKVVRCICYFSEVLKSSSMLSKIPFNTLKFLAQKVSLNTYAFETKKAILTFIEHHIYYFSHSSQAFDILELLFCEPIKDNFHTLELLTREIIDNYEGPITPEHVQIVENIIWRFIKEPCLCCIERAISLLELTDIKKYLPTETLNLMYTDIVTCNFREGLRSLHFEDLEDVYDKFIDVYLKDLNVKFLKQWIDPLSDIIFQLELFVCISLTDSLGIFLTKMCQTIFPNIKIIQFGKDDEDEPIIFMLNSWPNESEKSFEAMICYELFFGFIKRSLTYSFTNPLIKNVFKMYSFTLMDEMFKNIPWLDCKLQMLDYFSLHGDSFCQDCKEHELYVLKTLKMILVPDKGFNFNDYKTFYSLIFSLSNLNQEALLPEQRLTVVFKRDGLSLETANQVCFDVIATYIDKNSLDFQLKGLNLFYIWTSNYATSKDADFIKNVLNKILYCFQKSPNNNDLTAILFQHTLIVLEGLMKQLKSEFWNEYGVYFYRLIMFTIVDKFNNLQDINELNSFNLIINNILIYSYYKTDITKKFPHALYDIFQKILKMLQQTSYASGEHSKGLLLTLFGLLINLNCFEKQKNTTLENQLFSIYSQPKTLPPMKWINTLQRIPIHGKQAKQVWVECLRTSMQMYVKLLSSEELEAFYEVLVGYEKIAKKINDTIFQKEMNKLIRQLETIIKDSKSKKS